MYTQTMPYKEYGLRPPQILRRVVEGLRPSQPKLPNGTLMSDELWSFVNTCWHQDPGRRPESKHLLHDLQHALGPFHPIPGYHDSSPLHTSSEASLDRALQVVHDPEYIDIVPSPSSSLSSSSNSEAPSPAHEDFFLRRIPPIVTNNIDENADRRVEGIHDPASLIVNGKWDPQFRLPDKPVAATAKYTCKWQCEQ